MPFAVETPREATSVQSHEKKLRQSSFSGKAK